MMKKKWISFLLCLTVVAGTLAGVWERANRSRKRQKVKKRLQKKRRAKIQKKEVLVGELNIVQHLLEPQKIAALDELVAGFENEYPDIKVNQESTTLENYQDVLKLKFSTGDVPDVLFGEPKTYSVFVESW